MRVELLTNREVSDLMGKGLGSFRIRHLRTGIEWRSSYAGARTDHYDSTPMTPQDAAIFLSAINNNQEWLADDILVEVAPGVWVPAGLVPRMHGSIIGNAKPGAPFQSHSNVRPTTGWKVNGGHY